MHLGALLFGLTRRRLLLSRIELRPAVADDLAIAGEGVAAVDEARALRGAATLGGHLLGDIFPHSLIGDRGHGAQHLEVMGAALGTAQPLLQPPAPAGAELEALDDREALGDGGADLEGRGLGHRLDVAHDEMVVDRQADAHVVQRRPGMDSAAILIGEIIGFAVGHAAFDVPEPVLAAVSLELIAAVVQMLALDGGGQRHGDSLSVGRKVPALSQAALAVVGEASGVIFSRRIWLRWRSSTSKRKPWKAKTWPASGIRRASCRTRPAMVAAASSGRRQPQCRLRSRIVTVPSTMKLPSGSVLMPGTSMSCSSSISPTISSRISSSVTTPRSAPYSSTTSAKCSRRLRKACSWASSVVVSGTNQGGSARAVMSRPSTLPPLSCTARSSALAWSTPMMLSWSPRQSGRRV